MMQELCKKLSKAHIELLVAYWWVAWNTRNKRIFEGKKVNPLVSSAKAEAVVEAFKMVKELGKTSLNTKTNESKK